MLYKNLIVIIIQWEILIQSLKLEINGMTLNE